LRQHQVDGLGCDLQELGPERHGDVLDNVQSLRSALSIRITRATLRHCTTRLTLTPSASSGRIRTAKDEDRNGQALQEAQPPAP
jgi:hypothetical protein